MATGICWQYMGYFETQQLVILYNNIYIYYIYICQSHYKYIYICIIMVRIQQFGLLFAGFPVTCQLYSYVQLVGLCLTRFRSATGFSGFFWAPCMKAKRIIGQTTKSSTSKVPHLSGSNDWNPRIGRCFDQGIQARIDRGPKRRPTSAANFFGGKGVEHLDP